MANYWTNLISTKPHAAFDERQLAYKQGQGVIKVNEGGKDIIKILIPKLIIRASAIYYKQEAISAVREKGIAPNKALKSKHNHASGFLNYPKFTEDPIALPNYISFDTPINTIINFPYKG